MHGLLGKSLQIKTSVWDRYINTLLDAKGLAFYQQNVQDMIAQDTEMTKSQCLEKRVHCLQIQLPSLLRFITLATDIQQRQLEKVRQFPWAPRALVEKLGQTHCCLLHIKAQLLTHQQQLVQAIKLDFQDAIADQDLRKRVLDLLIYYDVDGVTSEDILLARGFPFTPATSQTCLEKQNQAFYSFIWEMEDDLAFGEDLFDKIHNRLSLYSNKLYQKLTLPLSTMIAYVPYLSRLWLPLLLAVTLGGSFLSAVYLGKTIGLMTLGTLGLSPITVPFAQKCVGLIRWIKDLRNQTSKQQIQMQMNRLIDVQDFIDARLSVGHHDLMKINFHALNKEWRQVHQTLKEVSIQLQSLQKKYPQFLPKTMKKAVALHDKQLKNVNNATKACLEQLLTRAKIAKSELIIQNGQPQLQLDYQSCIACSQWADAVNELELKDAFMALTNMVPQWLTFFNAKSCIHIKNSKSERIAPYGRGQLDKAALEKWRLQITALCQPERQRQVILDTIDFLLDAKPISLPHLKQQYVEVFVDEAKKHWQSLIQICFACYQPPQYDWAGIFNKQQREAIQGAVLHYQPEIETVKKVMENLIQGNPLPSALDDTELKRGFLLLDLVDTHQIISEGVSQDEMMSNQVRIYFKRYDGQQPVCQPLLKFLPQPELYPTIRECIKQRFLWGLNHFQTSFFGEEDLILFNHQAALNEENKLDLNQLVQDALPTGVTSHQMTFLLQAEQLGLIEQSTVDEIQNWHIQSVAFAQPAIHATLPRAVLCQS